MSSGIIHATERVWPNLVLVGKVTGIYPGEYRFKENTPGFIRQSFPKHVKFDTIRNDRIINKSRTA